MRPNAFSVEFIAGGVEEELVRQAKFGAQLTVGVD